MTTPLDPETKRQLQQTLRAFYERELDQGQRAYFVVREGRLEPTPMGRHWLWEHRRVFAELLALQPGERFLDVGCGEGYYTLALAQPAGLTVAVDGAWSALRLMRALRDFDAKRVQTCVCDVEQLPFGEAQFDKALCSHLLEHVLDDRAVVAEIRRVLKVGAVAVFAIPLKYTTPYRLVRAMEALGRALLRPGKKATSVAPPGVLDLRLIGRQAHIRHYSVNVFTQMLSEMGFHIQRVVGMWFHDPRHWFVYRTQPSRWWYALGTRLAKLDPNLGAGLVVQTIRR